MRERERGSVREREREEVCEKEGGCACEREGECACERGRVCESEAPRRQAANGAHAPSFVWVRVAIHKRPYVGVSQGTVLGFGDGFGAILWETVAKS